MADANKLVINGNHYKIMEVKGDPIFNCRKTCAFRHRCANPEYQYVLHVTNNEGIEANCLAKPCVTIGMLMYGQKAKDRHFIFKLTKICK